jgi:hypothetical protein
MDYGRDYRVISRQDFIEQLHAGQRALKRVDLVGGIVFLAVLFASLPIAGWLDKQELAGWVKPLYFSVWFVFLFANIALAIWMRKRCMQHPALVCPACGKSLARAAAQVVLITGGCAFCGAQILDEWRGPARESLRNERGPKSEFIRRLHAMQRGQLRLGVVLLIALIAAALLVIVPLAKFLNQRWQLGYFGLGVFFLTPFALLSFGLLSFAARRTKRRINRLGLVCGACGKPLVGLPGRTVVVTEKCPFCGVSVLAE